MSETPTWDGKVMHLLCVVVKMNIYKRFSSVKSWQWFSDLDANDCSTQIPHKSPWVRSLGVEVIDDQNDIKPNKKPPYPTVRETEGSKHAHSKMRLLLRHVQPGIVSLRDSQAFV